MRILIVEDEVAIRDQVAERLRSDGFVVDTASDGREGMYCATEYLIDLAVVDLGLPEMDGIELIVQLRQQQTLGVQTNISGQALQITLPSPYISHPFADCNNTNVKCRPCVRSSLRRIPFSVS